MAEPDALCQGRGIPEHLHQLGRAPENVFAAEESVYRRFKPELKLELSEDHYEIFTTRRMSVNRERYSARPEDVLFNVDGPPHFDSWGVAALEVEGIQSIRVQHPDPKQRIEYTLKVRHKPERCMYPHCEIEVFANGEPVPEIKPSSVKTKIKSAMANACQVVKAPGA